MSYDRDVVIIGGGLVGGLTALLLAEGGVQATVLDAAAILDQDQVLGRLDSRVLALSQASIHLLKRVGVWQEIERCMPYTGMQIWNKNGFGALEFGHESANLPSAEQSLGVMVEPALLNLAIQNRLRVCLDDYRHSVRVSRIEKAIHGWQVELADGSFIHTALVIGADGANSFVREQAMIELDVLDYHQSAISCAIQTQRANHYVARQIFLDTGPLAFLPMASLDKNQQGYWQSVVWTLPEQDAQEYQALDDQAFKQLLTQQSHHMLGQVLAVHSRASFHLKARSASHYVLDGLALVGDAAHVIHPLAGQGVNIGCLDAAILCDCLLHDQARGAWAHIQTLRRYEHKRRALNLAMMHSMSAIGWLETTTLSPALVARNIVRRQVNHHDWLKDLFMLHANGLDTLNATRYAV